MRLKGQRTSKILASHLTAAKAQMRLPVRSVGRPGISSLPLPSSRFDLRRTPGFEGEQDKEDEKRARMLRLRAKHDVKGAEALLGLADRIDPTVTRRPASLASSRYMRDQRIRVIGALWELIHEA